MPRGVHWWAGLRGDMVDLGEWLHALPRDPHTALFLALFSLFLFLSYVMVHNLAALADRGGDPRSRQE
jgi:hypothetical protein